MAFDKRLPNTERKLRELFAKLRARHGTVLVVVDQPPSIEALLLTVARVMGCEDQAIAELELIVGFDDDLAGEATGVANRLHGPVDADPPVAGAVLGPRLQHPAVLTLLERLGSPTRIRKAGRRRLVTLLRPKAPRMAERLIDEIFASLDEQTVTAPDAEEAALIGQRLAGSLTAVLDQRKLPGPPRCAAASRPHHDLQREIVTRDHQCSWTPFTGSSAIAPLS
ncbi:hypothetical protein AQI70_10490 [Streptomyces curacoi]|uniref:Uncharacterized protein n=1 Tax=Streptomyces curacoi TaxID=146536 RepID=A0A117PGM8_9ACTN|nr:hypothetical protein AQI70_10490 [Streptomyces curacoi]